jgi:hypothetical protein
MQPTCCVEGVTQPSLLRRSRAIFQRELTNPANLNNLLLYQRALWLIIWLSVANTCSAFVSNAFMHSPRGEMFDEPG